MKSKILKIVLDVVLSVVVFFATAVLSAWGAGLILGSTKDSSGEEVINGGGAISITILVICVTVSIVFGVWFYKFLTNYKVTKINGVKNVGE